MRSFTFPADKPQAFTENGPLRASDMSVLDAAALISEALDRSGNIVAVTVPLPDSRLGLRIQYVNNAFTVALGHSGQDACHQPLDLLISPQADQTAIEAIRRSVDRCHSLQIELLCQHRSGQSRWLGLHFMALEDPDTGAPCFVIQGRDITEKLRERQEQRSVQQLLASVFLFIDSPVAIVDEGGAVRMANPRLADLLALPTTEIEGRSWTDFIDAREADRDLDIRKRQAAGERRTSVAIRLLRPDGAILPVTAVFAVVDRPALERFRVITFHRRPGGIRFGAARRREPASAESSPDPNLLLTGRIALVGLDEARSTLGVRWPEHADQALSAAEEVLQRSLGPDESYMRTDDQGFVIRLQGDNEENAALRTALIARDIRTELIGTGSDPASAAVTAIAAGLRRKPGEGEDLVALMDILDRRLSAERGRIEQNARKALREAMESAACVLEPVTGPDRRQSSPLAYVTLPDEVHRHVIPAVAALPPSRLDGFEFDAFLLTLAAERIAADALKGARGIYLVPVSFEGLANRRRSQRFIDICRDLDPPVRNRLGLMMTGVPPSVPQSRVADTIQTISPFCRFVGLEIERPEAPPLDLAQHLIPIVALSASSVPPGARGPGRDLARLVGHVRASRSHLLIRRVADAAAAAEMAESGIELFSWD
jgi:PAS domain S-box-containing protein